MRLAGILVVAVMSISCTKTVQQTVGPEETPPDPETPRLVGRIIGAWEFSNISDPPSWLSDVKQVYAFNGYRTDVTLDRITNRHNMQKLYGHDRLVFDPTNILKTRYDPIGTRSLSGNTLDMRIMGLVVTGTVEVNGNTMFIGIH